MRQRFGTILVAAGLLAMAGSMLLSPAQAVPQCNGKGPQCNQFAYNSKACSECKKCIAAGGVYVHKGTGKFAGLCKLKAKPMSPRPSGPGAPAPMEMQKRK